MFLIHVEKGLRMLGNGSVVLSLWFARSPVSGSDALSPPFAQSLVSGTGTDVLSPKTLQ